MSSFTDKIIVLVCSILRMIQALEKVPNLETTVYSKAGDIDIGGLFSVHSFSKTQPCGTSLYSTTRFQHIQAVAYAVKKINEDSNLLPNISLGYKILDDCVKSSTALGQTLNFIARNDTCRMNDSAPYYKVKGVVGPLPSGNSILVASLLGLYKIPQISPLSTSAVLSDKTKYEYFLRVVPPDQYQAKAIVSLIDSYGWKYISAINSEGTYGSTGIRQVKSKAAELGICVAYAREISQGTSESDYDDIIRALMQNREARAVVMFVGLDAGRKLLQAAQRAKLYGQFVWVFSDTFGNMNGHVGLEDVSAGSFFFKVFSVGVEDFNRDYVSLNPTNVNNPWYNQLWQTVFNCSYEANSEYTSCNSYKSINESRSYKAEPTASFVIDAVYTFGHALDELIRRDCPHLMSQLTADRSEVELDNCIRGDKLLSVLRKTSFKGTAGLVEFDDKGDMLGKYVISQLQHDKVKDEYQVSEIGYWDMRTGALDVTGQSQWTAVQHEGDEKLSDVPTSVCSRECTAGEFKIQKELKCCWECRRCRSNEITTVNFTQCEECPQFNWPNQEVFTFCEPIDPYFMKWTDPLAITFLAGAVLGIIMCGMVIVCFAVYRNRKIIMASCPTLTFIMLVGNLIAYATIFVLIAKPNNTGCGINRFAFHFSFALNYAPLLAKSSRIYRIFDSGRRGHQRPKFISTRDQVILSTILIAIEVAISVTTLFISPPSAMLNMPVSTEKFVELLCDMPIDSLVAPMAFNILLTIVCLVYGFKTRKLPDNFNESWYIFLSVCSTLFLWLVFVPSYFTAFHAYHKTVVLSAALFLSSTAMVLCLYSPKIYALFYVNEDDLTFQTKRNQKAGAAWTTQVHPSGSANPAGGTVEGGQGSAIVLEENGQKTTA